MAFSPDNWARSTDAINTGSITIDSVLVNAPASFTYQSGTDNLATIAGANYFSPAVFVLSVGDIILCQGSDAFGIMSIVTVDNDAATVTTLLSAATIADDSITSAKMSPTLLKYVAVPVTSTQFLGMNAAPVELVAAPGAGFILSLESASIVMTYGTIAYTSGGVVLIQYDSVAGGSGTAVSNEVSANKIDETADTMNQFIQATTKTPIATSGNKSFTISNKTGAFLTGDSDFVVHVWYRVIPL